jgi:large subunit ribosomal protein L21
MKFAVIETGGKQYLVKPNETLKIEKLNGQDTEVFFDKVFLMADGEKIEIGKPYLNGVKIPAKREGEGRAKKITIIKFKSKTRFRKKQGHRQLYTKVKILNF